MKHDIVHPSPPIIQPLQPQQVLAHHGHLPESQKFPSILFQNEDELFSNHCISYHLKFTPTVGLQYGTLYPDTILHNRHKNSLLNFVTLTDLVKAFNPLNHDPSFPSSNNTENHLNYAPPYAVCKPT